VAARGERGGYSAARAAHHWRRRAGPGRRRPWRWRRHDRSRCASRLGRTTSCGVQTRTAWARPGVVRRFRRSVARTPDCAASAPRSRERIALRCRHRGCGADTSVRSRRGSQWSASARSCATSTTVNASRSTTKPNARSKECSASRSSVTVYLLVSQTSLHGGRLSKEGHEPDTQPSRVRVTNPRVESTTAAPCAARHLVRAGHVAMRARWPRGRCGG
jgi:hypothetical protein